MYPEENDSTVVSSIIWGSQWDAVLRWFQSFGGETAGYVTDSCINETIGQFGIGRVPTGSNNAYAVKNIYDMTGNACDCTIESEGDSVRVHRRRRFYCYSCGAAWLGDEIFLLCVYELHGGKNSTIHKIIKMQSKAGHFT